MVGIKIIGATVLRLSERDSSGQLLETRQMTYVTDMPGRLFISREACIDLGIISDNFPTVGETQVHPLTVPKHDVSDCSLISDCGCPRRQHPLPPLSIAILCYC